MNAFYDSKLAIFTTRGPCKISNVILNFFQDLYLNTLEGFLDSETSSE